MRVPISRALVARVAGRVLEWEGVRGAMLSITFVSSRAIAALNRAHLGHRGPTDVISFGFVPPGTGKGESRMTAVIGDIYIAPDVARANARRHGVAVREELARLVVHGVLHVLGYDHPDGQSRRVSVMWRRQERLLRRALRAEAR